VKAEEIARITGEAVEVAKANASLKNKPVVLAPVAAYRDYWQTPHERDPFATPIQEKLELIRAAAAEAKNSQQVFAAGCTLAGIAGAFLSVPVLKGYKAYRAMRDSGVPETYVADMQGLAGAKAQSMPKPFNAAFKENNIDASYNALSNSIVLKKKMVLSSPVIQTADFTAWKDFLNKNPQRIK
jgi:hydroxyethylthiazole kinase-like sugar kinase family protein